MSNRSTENRKTPKAVYKDTCAILEQCPVPPSPRKTWPKRHARNQQIQALGQRQDLDDMPAHEEILKNRPAYMPYDGPKNEDNDKSTRDMFPNLPIINNPSSVIDEPSMTRAVYNFEGSICAGVWADDKALIAGCHLAVRGNEDIAFIDRHYIFEPFNQSYALSDLPDPYETAYEDQRFFVLPCHDSGAHYFLVILDMMHRKLYFMDTSKAAKRNFNKLQGRIKQKLDTWVAIMKGEWNEDESDEEGHTERRPASVKWVFVAQTPQPLDNACGVLVPDLVRFFLREPAAENADFWTERQGEDPDHEYDRDWIDSSLAVGETPLERYNRVKYALVYTARRQLGNIKGDPVRYPPKPQCSYDLLKNGSYRKFYNVPNSVVKSEDINSDNWRNLCNLVWDLWTEKRGTESDNPVVIGDDEDNEDDQDAGPGAALDEVFANLDNPLDIDEALANLVDIGDADDGLDRPSAPASSKKSSVVPKTGAPSTPASAQPTSSKKRKRGRQQSKIATPKNKKFSLATPARSPAGGSLLSTRSSFDGQEQDDSPRPKKAKRAQSNAAAAGTDLAPQARALSLDDGFNAQGDILGFTAEEDAEAWAEIMERYPQHQ